VSIRFFWAVPRLELYRGTDAHEARRVRDLARLLVQDTLLMRKLNKQRVDTKACRRSLCKALLLATEPEAIKVYQLEDVVFLLGDYHKRVVTR
jgi:hypothetical protein